jgi:hypothetical protein
MQKVPLVSSPNWALSTMLPSSSASPWAIEATMPCRSGQVRVSTWAGIGGGSRDEGCRAASSAVLVT